MAYKKYGNWVFVSSTWESGLFLLFLAHLSHRCKVSYCHHPLSVVRRASCVANNCFKYPLNRMLHWLLYLYQVCSNNGPGSKKALRWGVLGSKMKHIFINPLLKNFLAQVLEIWYVALPGGPFASLIRASFQGSKWPLARGLVSNHRNT